MDIVRTEIGTSIVWNQIVDNQSMQWIPLKTRRELLEALSDKLSEKLQTSVLLDSRETSVDIEWCGHMINISYEASRMIHLDSTAEQVSSTLLWITNEWDRIMNNAVNTYVTLGLDDEGEF